MTKTIPITEAREKLTELPWAFSRRLSVDAIAVTRRGEPVLAILPWEFYDGLVETLEILSDKELTESLRKGIKEATMGKLIPWERVKRELHL